jgi:hypothetical protein
MYKFKYKINIESSLVLNRFYLNSSNEMKFDLQIVIPTTETAAENIIDHWKNIMSAQFKQHFVLLAAYNKWAFTTLFKCLQRVSNEHYHKNMGLFFNSIHRTLNHILMADIVWHTRLNGKTVDPSISKLWSSSASDWENVIKDRQEVEKRILQQCDTWIQFINELPADKVKP